MLRVKGLSKTYATANGGFKAIEWLDFEVSAGEFLCIVGPSGAGKTTLLRCIAGLLPLTSGEVSLNGEAVNGPPREMAVVFQDYSRSLLPWMTVEANVALPLKNKGMRRADYRHAAGQALESVGLRQYLQHYPWQLSGGMQQRVAIARALAYNPKVLLMDEPFASVDAQTRADLEDLMLRLRREFAVTVVFVTHDIDEAVYLADRVIVLTHNPCRIRDTVAIDLPQPRDQIATKQLTQFGVTRARILQEIRGAVADHQHQGGGNHASH
jgi:NitT/TauT family transport system ATP-binding protein